MATANGANPDPRPPSPIPVPDGQTFRVGVDRQLVKVLREANEILKGKCATFPRDHGAMTRLIENCINRAEDLHRAIILRDVARDGASGRREIFTELRAFQYLASAGAVPSLTSRIVSVNAHQWGKLQGIGAPSFYANYLWSNTRDVVTSPLSEENKVIAYTHLTTLNLAFRHVGGPAGEASAATLLAIAGAMTSPEFARRPSGAVGSPPFRRALELIAALGVAARPVYLRSPNVLIDLGVIAASPTPAQCILPYLEIAVRVQSFPESQRSAISREFGAMLERVGSREVWPQLLWNLAEAVSLGRLDSSEKVCSAIREIGYRTAATALADTRGLQSGEQTLKDWDALSPDFRGRPHSLTSLLLPESRNEPGPVPARVREFEETYQSLVRRAPGFGLATWSRLDNVFEGFSTFTYDCKSLPSGAAAPLVQFGCDLGRVRFLRVRDPKVFPGPGFMLDQFDLRRMFPVPTADRDGVSFAPYKAAWPGLAEGFDRLSGVSVLFARGVIALRGSPRVSGAVSERWLVIPNVHFDNRLSITPMLMPDPVFRKLRMLEALSDQRDTASEPILELPSLSTALSKASAEEGVIPVGAASFLSRLAVTMPPEYHALRTLSAQELHLDSLILEWNDYTSHIRNSALGRSKLESYHAQRTRLNGERQRLTEKVLSRIGDSFMDCQRALDSMEEAAWFMDRFDQLMLGFGRWKNGHTLPKAREVDSDQRFATASDQSAEVVFSEGRREVNWQSESQRMVTMVYDIHAQRAKEVWDLRQYPVLAVTDATFFSVFPSELPYLDTWDMSMHIGEQIYRLNSKVFDELSERMWHQRFMPLVLDDSNGPRSMKFLPRESVGLAGNR